MIIFLRKKISVDALIICIMEQHGERGLRYLAYRALQILVNEFDIEIEPAAEAWLENLKTGKVPVRAGRICPGCGEDLVARDDKHDFCKKCETKMSTLKWFPPPLP